jgi:hypothetical protein
VVSLLPIVGSLLRGVRSLFRSEPSLRPRPRLEGPWARKSSLPWYVVPLFLLVFS